MTQAEDFFNLMPQIWEEELIGHKNANWEAASRKAFRAGCGKRGDDVYGYLWQFLDGSRVFITKLGNEVRPAKSKI